MMAIHHLRSVLITAIIGIVCFIFSKFFLNPSKYNLNSSIDMDLLITGIVMLITFLYFESGDYYRHELIREKINYIKNYEWRHRHEGIKKTRQKKRSNCV